MVGLPYVMMKKLNKHSVNIMICTIHLLFRARYCIEKTQRFYDKNI